MAVDPCLHQGIILCQIWCHSLGSPQTQLLLLEGLCVYVIQNDNGRLVKYEWKIPL